MNVVAAMTGVSQLGQAMPRLRVNLPKVDSCGDPWKISQKRYKGVKLLGQGSFGKAFSATRSGKKVIIKTAFGQKGVVSMREAFEALYREFVVLGKLQKFPFIPRLIEVGPDYFVQEDVGGESMLKILAKKGLEAREILSVVVGTGLMISKIHDEGIAHRDLEPRNILLTPQGSVIIDFGIAVPKIENDKLFKEGMAQDLVSLLNNIALSATASDVTREDREILASVVNKFRGKVIEGSVNEKTAKDLSDELLFVLAQLGARARRGKNIRKEKIKVRVV